MEDKEEFKMINIVFLALAVVVVALSLLCSSQSKMIEEQQKELDSLLLITNIH